MPPPDQSKTPSSRSFQRPTGTRDLYPQDLLRKRYIEKMWRDTAIRHGFEEIDGPAFEHLDLYTAKSGEGIVSEIFGVFSGKNEEELAAIRAGAPAPFALRPEFTPTLARMYAARAAQLPKPTKWFWQQNCYRAEKPQRGRLREFGQWNCDVIGGDSAAELQYLYDTELLDTQVATLALAGLASCDVRVVVNHRWLLASWLESKGIAPDVQSEVFEVIDARSKMNRLDFAASLARFGLTESQAAFFQRGYTAFQFESDEGIAAEARMYFADLTPLRLAISAMRIAEWVDFDASVARGLAYYTGMVFEVHEASGAERAIAGGGRYDNLIETFGGPPTPAVGFGMGDVVLSLVLEDRGLMPEGKDLLAALSAPSASLRPDVFVISNGTPEADAKMRPLVAELRRGVESPAWREKEGRKPWDADRYAVPPLHARHTYKATKNIGKLLQEASAQHARFAAIIENDREATLKDLDRREETKGVPLDRVASLVGAGSR